MGTALKLQNGLPHWRVGELLLPTDPSDRSEHAEKRGGGEQQKQYSSQQANLARKALSCKSYEPEPSSQSNAKT